MNDSSTSTDVQSLTTAAILMPVIALAAIIGGISITEGPLLAQEESQSMRLQADLNDDYFTTGDDARLAQGMLEPRSEDSNDEVEDDNDIDNDTNDRDSEEDMDQCSDVYLNDHLRIDFNNDREQVLKLQSFLKTFENYDYVSLTGTFDETTLRAVKAFQSRYAEDILEPWGYQADEATGYVYITTKQKINEIYCDDQFLLSQQDQAEIRQYRQKLNTWRAQGASFETPQYLANYYGYTWSEYVTRNTTDDTAATVDSDDENQADDGITVDETPSDAATTSTSTDDRGFFERLFGIEGDDDNGELDIEAEAEDGVTEVEVEYSDGAEEEFSFQTMDRSEVISRLVEETDLTESEIEAVLEFEIDDDADDDDERGFFERLFGIGDDDEVATTSTSTDSEATTTDDADDDMATTSTSSATSGIDNVAAGIYTGVNSIINFLLSPTFLLIVLVILILLLVATLIDGNEEDEEGGDNDADSTDPWYEYRSEEPASEDSDDSEVTEDSESDSSDEDDDSSNESDDSETDSTDRS